MGRINNKVAIVTGASSGIGRATAKLLAAEGANVVVTARRETELESVRTEIHVAGGNAVAVAGDIQHEEHAAELVERARTEYGGLDMAFNNAGALGPLLSSTDVDVADWRETLDTNLTSAFLCAKHQLPALVERGGGSIVFTSTFVGYAIGMPGMAPYAASKAGLIGLTRTLAAEYGALGVRVNALLPGGTDTPMARAVSDTEEKRGAVAGLHAMRRIALPEEIAHSALYLLSGESSFTTGIALLADGGISICKA